MKARLLRKILNDTKYNISNHENYIAVGSSLCHNLIAVDKKTLAIKYALGNSIDVKGYLRNKGNEELLFIYLTFELLIESGEIQDIINGKDEIENPLPVFTVENGVLIESKTDFYGWPNTDDNGICMYDNTHFPTKEQAIEYGIKEYTAGRNNSLRRIEEVEEELQRIKLRLETQETYILQLNELKNQTIPLSSLDFYCSDFGAEFSNDRKYRYSLRRIWDRTKPLVMFVGLNPSTANETKNDPTIRSCARIASENGYGGFFMMNCWAYIATNPTLLKINPESEKWNNEMLTIIASKCKAVVFAWGNFKIVKELGRDVELAEMFPYARALAINKNGSPKHPLYVKSDTKFIDWKRK